MDLHSKRKGTLGELAIAKHLTSLGYAVFTELGDLSRTDLIVLVDSEPVKLQVKAYTSKNEVVNVYSKKSGPNYSFKYQLKDVDVFAVYVLDKDYIFFVSAKEVLANASHSSFRFSKAKNGQQTNVRFVSDYQSFERALRDCTGNTLTVQAEGDETVQATTRSLEMPSES